MTALPSFKHLANFANPASGSGSRCKVVADAALAAPLLVIWHQDCELVTTKWWHHHNLASSNQNVHDLFRRCLASCLAFTFLCDPFFSSVPSSLDRSCPSTFLGGVPLAWMMMQGLHTGSHTSRRLVLVWCWHVLQHATHQDDDLFEEYLAVSAFVIWFSFHQICWNHYSFSLLTDKLKH